MKLNTITPVILTFNEEVNISRTLNNLKWADQVIIVDSYSNDTTRTLCNNFNNTYFHQRRFTTHHEQWNAAIGHVATPWVLSLDADYQVTPELLSEICQLEPSKEIAGYRIPFIFAVDSRPLSAHLLPPRIALFRRDQAHYIQDGHTQNLVVDGMVHSLSAPLIHDDRKSFSRWVSAQKKYARLEAEKLQKTPFNHLPIQDKLRSLIFPAPPIVLLYTLIYKRLILEGPAGWKYSLHRFIAECVLSLALIRKFLS